MVQVIEQQGDILGRLGKGVAEGLSSQLPKEIERYRLSSGLKALEGKKVGTPLQQLSELYSIPGMTPEIASQAQQYLRNQAAIKEGLPKHPSQITPEGIQPSDQQMGTPSTATRPQRLIGTPEAIRERAAIRSVENPNQFPTIESGEAYERAAVERQEKLISDTDTAFSKDLERRIQSQGADTFGQIDGDLQTKMMEKAQDDVLAGKMTPSDAGKRYSEKLLDYAKNNQRMKTLGAKFYTSKTPSGTKAALDEIRKTFKEFDKLDAFRNQLISDHNLSPERADYLAYPVKENKPLNNYISNLKKKAPGSEMTLPTSKYGKPKDTYKSNQEIAAEIAKNLSDKDSLNSIALELKAKNYDGKAIADLIRSNPEVRLNERQRSEKAESPNFFPTLGDLYFFTLGGMDKLVELQ